MARSFPPGDMRVSDAERDIALSELSEHFQAGRLTHEEFDERSDRALKARTGNDLRDLFTDLPAPGDSMASQVPAETGNKAAQPGREPAPPAARGGHWPAGRIVLACVIAAIVIGNVAASFGNGANHGNFGWLVPVVILLFVFRRIRG
jgi:Domain of unknown function (DUF1707)